MGATARKQMRIAPRYKVSDDQPRGIRFISSKNRKIVLTKIVDISETGISFITNHKLCPRMGEVIKMDFAPPGSMQIAVQGQVMRIAEPSKDSEWAQFPGTVLVGVAFYNVPRAYKKMLTRTLNSLIDVRNTTYRREVSRSNNEPSWFLENLGSLFATAAILVAFGGLIYYVLNYYDGKTVSKESPWAQNFFDKNLPSKPGK